MWDEEDGFFYDVLRLPDGRATRLKVRSLVGLLPLCAATVYPAEVLTRLPLFVARVLDSRSGARRCSRTSIDRARRAKGRYMLSLLDEKKLRRVLAACSTPAEFLERLRHPLASPATTCDNPYVVLGRRPGVPRELPPGRVRQRHVRRQLELARPDLDADQRADRPRADPAVHLLRRRLPVECPTGSGKMMTLFEVARSWRAGWSRSSAATRRDGGRSSAAPRSSRRPPLAGPPALLRVLPRRQRRRRRRQPPDRVDRAGLAADQRLRQVDGPGDPGEHRGRAAAAPDVAVSRGTVGSGTRAFVARPGVWDSRQGSPEPTCMEDGNAVDSDRRVAPVPAQRVHGRASPRPGRPAISGQDCRRRGPVARPSGPRDPHGTCGFMRAADGESSSALQYLDSRAAPPAAAELRASSRRSWTEG